jgi:hypothetical protein
MTIDLSRAARILSFILIWLYAAAGVAAFVVDEFAANEVFWAAVFFGAAAAILFGQLASRLSPWVSVAIVSVGALVGGLALFVTIVVPIAAAALVAINVTLARRASAA